MRRIRGVRTTDELWQYAKDNGLHEAADLLKEYVDMGQPGWFAKELTTRGMAKVVAAGASGKDHKTAVYGDGNTSIVVYLYMWGMTDTLEETEEVILCLNA